MFEMFEVMSFASYETRKAPAHSEDIFSCAGQLCMYKLKLFYPHDMLRPKC